MQYSYRAYNSAGGVITGVAQGANEQEILKKLGDQDLMVVGLKAADNTVDNSKAITTKGRVKVPLPVLASFTRQLATMVRAGLPLVRAFESLGRQAKHPGLKTVVQEVRQAVESGATFSDALHLFPRVFSKVYVSMIKAGENGGLLAEVLDRMATYLEMSARLRSRVRSAMMYPLIVCTLGIGICLFMLTCIIPVFVDIFKEFGSQLPLPTLILMKASTIVRTNLLAILAAGVGTGLLLRYLRRTKMGTLAWDSFVLRAPVFGTLVNKIAFARFARTLSSMLHSGVPVLSSLKLAGTAVDNVVLEAAIEKVREAIEHGATIHDAMIKQRQFPDMLLEMVAAGEETGAVDELLNQVADHYDREVETMLSGLTSMLEPILILFLGVAVGGVVIAMFLPIFKMTDAVQF